MHLRKSSLDECLSDNQFLSFLDHDDVPSDLTAQRRYPSVALIECVADLTQPHYKVRRLHLVIADLWRPWKIHKSQVRFQENVAAQAFAEHIEGLHMPPCVNEKIGRLVGYMELKKNRSKGTSLDIVSENRHEVLKQKRMLIGCGGGFQQECSQSYSPVSQWIIEVALTLTDESQQFGNIEETSVIARTSRTCLNVWAGDHRQTPGGLKNTVECRLFRQKLLQRPLALRCGTVYIQPHEMYRVVCRYLDGPWGSPSHQFEITAVLSQIFRTTTA